MILDADSPSKAPLCSQSTVRQPPVSSPYHVIDTTVTPYLRNASASNAYSETTPLLYHRAPESMYDDSQPPAYNEINGSSPKTSARIRFWVGCVIVLVILSGACALSVHHFKNTEPVPARPPNNPVKEPTAPPPSPPPLPPQLPQLPHFPDPSTPYVPPTSGRTDLCRPWAYTSASQDNRPTDRLVYTVPSQLPLHIESSAICPTSSGRFEVCSKSDEPISGKLQVIGADIESPEIEVSLRHGADDDLDRVSVCLTQNNNRWILGLYVWSDDVAPLSQRLAPSAFIVVKLPHSQIHTLSTNLDHFTQIVGSESNENGLVFDTLEFRSSGRGGVEIGNVTAATIYAKIKDDNLHIQDARITKLLQLESEAGLLVGLVTLVHQDESPSPVQIDARNALGTVSIDAILEYPTHPRTTPHFDINLYSMLSPAIAHIRDPRGTNSLASGTLSTLPIIQVNVTSQYAMAQASIPVTYHGSMELSSEYAAIATNDRASGLPGRKVSWTERMGMVYRGAVEWTANEAPRQSGVVTISTQFAIARLMLLGLMDGHTDRWYAEGTEIAYNSPVARTGIRL